MSRRRFTTTLTPLRRRALSVGNPNLRAPCCSADAKTEGARKVHPITSALDLTPSMNSFVFLDFLSRSAPLLSRLHPHAASRVIHHVHQRPGVTAAALGPRMGCWPLQCPRGRVKTGGLTGHLLLNVDNGGWSGTFVGSLIHVHCAKAMENHPRFYGGLGSVLSHSAA